MGIFLTPELKNLCQMKGKIRFHLFKNMGVVTNEGTSDSFRPQMHLLGYTVNNMKTSLFSVFKPTTILYLVWPTSVRNRSLQKKLRREKLGGCGIPRPKETQGELSTLSIVKRNED